MKIFKVLLFSLLISSVGCEDNEIDHRPQPGMGAIGIDNNTSADIEFYIDGENRGTVNDWNETAIDLAPGAYRLVLNDQDGERSYSGDVDVIVDKLTEVTVTTSITDYYKFDVVFVYR